LAGHSYPIKDILSKKPLSWDIAFLCPDAWWLCLLKARPDLKVIVLSGYSIDGPVQELLDAGAQAFIQKPFSPAPV